MYPLLWSCTKPYSHKSSSHASTHPHQSLLVLVFKLYVQYAPTWKIKRKTVKCLYWAFLCQLSIYGFQWQLSESSSYYAEQRNVHLNQKHSAPTRLTKLLSPPQNKTMQCFYSLSHPLVRDCENSKLCKCTTVQCKSVLCVSIPMVYVALQRHYRGSTVKVALHLKSWITPLL